MSNGNIASNDLIWLLVRKQNAYIHKRPGAHKIFSNERGNPKGISSPKYSGLANSHTIDISPAEGGRGVNVSWKAKDASPFAVNSAIQSKEIKAGGRNALLAVKEILPETGREDLYKEAYARTSAILKTQNPRKAQRVRAKRPVDRDE
ncbi:hypothetical protein JCM8097_002654 [Rhodosporidiobolus ruineniae]